MKQPKVRPTTIVKYAEMLRALRYDAEHSTEKIYMSTLPTTYKVAMDVATLLLKMEIIGLSDSVPSGIIFRDKRDAPIIARELAYASLKYKSKWRKSRTLQTTAEPEILEAKTVEEKLPDSTAELPDASQGAILIMNPMEAQLMRILLNSSDIPYLQGFSQHMLERMK